MWPCHTIYKDVTSDPWQTNASIKAVATHYIYMYIYLFIYIDIYSSDGPSADALCVRANFLADN